MSIVADSRPVAAPTKRERLLFLLRGLRAASLDAVAHLGMAFDRRALAIAADTVHDRHLITAAGVAALGAGESSVSGCRCHVRFDRILRLVNGAQRYDAVEDGHLGRAFDEVDAGRSRIRIVAGRFDQLLSGRSDS